jgi:hypothetical protein
MHFGFLCKCILHFIYCTYSNVGKHCSSLFYRWKKIKCKSTIRPRLVCKISISLENRIVIFTPLFGNNTYTLIEFESKLLQKQKQKTKPITWILWVSNRPRSALKLRYVAWIHDFRNWNRFCHGFNDFIVL